MADISAHADLSDDRTDFEFLIEKRLHGAGAQLLCEADQLVETISLAAEGRATLYVLDSLREGFALAIQRFNLEVGDAVEALKARDATQDDGESSSSSLQARSA